MMIFWENQQANLNAPLLMSIFWEGQQANLNTPLLCRER
jgi:hypothetical protein